jgi:hypothetical protein
MNTYTVIGVYDDNGQVFTDHIMARDAHEAMRLASKPAVVASAGTDLQIIGVIEGRHTLTAPCEDRGTTAYASDLSEEA